MSRGATPGVENEQRVRNSGFWSGVSGGRVVRGGAVPLRHRVLLVRQPGRETGARNFDQI